MCMLTTQPILKYEDLEKLIKDFRIPNSTELILRSGIHQRFIEGISLTSSPRVIILHPLRSHKFEVCTLDFLVSCQPKSQDLFCVNSNNPQLRIPIASVSFDFHLLAIIFHLADFSVPTIARNSRASHNEY